LIYFLSSRDWITHGLELNLDYNPTKPTESDILIHGTWRANSRAQAFFLDRALEAIRLRQSYEPQDQAREACYRDVARSNGLVVLLERAILNHDILVSLPLIIPLLFVMGYTHWLVGWLVGQSVGWLVNPLVGWSILWLVEEGKGARG